MIRLCVAFLLIALAGARADDGPDYSAAIAQVLQQRGFTDVKVAPFELGAENIWLPYVHRSIEGTARRPAKDGVFEYNLKINLLHFRTAEDREHPQLPSAKNNYQELLTKAQQDIARGSCQAHDVAIAGGSFPIVRRKLDYASWLPSRLDRQGVRLAWQHGNYVCWIETSFSIDVKLDTLTGAGRPWSPRKADPAEVRAKCEPLMDAQEPILLGAATAIDALFGFAPQSLPEPVYAKRTPAEIHATLSAWGMMLAMAASAETPMYGIGSGDMPRPFDWIRAGKLAETVQLAMAQLMQEAAFHPQGVELTTPHRRRLMSLAHWIRFLNLREVTAIAYIDGESGDGFFLGPMMAEHRAPKPPPYPLSKPAPENEEINWPEPLPTADEQHVWFEAGAEAATATAIHAVAMYEAVAGYGIVFLMLASGQIVQEVMQREQTDRGRVNLTPLAFTTLALAAGKKRVLATPVGVVLLALLGVEAGFNKQVSFGIADPREAGMFFVAADQIEPSNSYGERARRVVLAVLTGWLAHQATRGPPQTAVTTVKANAEPESMLELATRDVAIARAQLDPAQPDSAIVGLRITDVVKKQGGEYFHPVTGDVLPLEGPAAHAVRQLQGAVAVGDVKKVLGVKPGGATVELAPDQLSKIVDASGSRWRLLEQALEPDPGGALVTRSAPQPCLADIVALEPVLKPIADRLAAAIRLPVRDEVLVESLFRDLLAKIEGVFPTFDVFEADTTHGKFTVRGRLCNGRQLYTIEQPGSGLPSTLVLSSARLQSVYNAVAAARGLADADATLMGLLAEDVLARRHPADHGGFLVPSAEVIAGIQRKALEIFRAGMPVARYLNVLQEDAGAAGARVGETVEVAGAAPIATGRFATMGPHEGVMGEMAEARLGGKFVGAGASSPVVEGEVGGMKVSFYGLKSPRLSEILVKMRDVTKLGADLGYTGVELFIGAPSSSAAEVTQFLATRESAANLMRGQLTARGQPTTTVNPVISKIHILTNDNQWVVLTLP